MDLQHIIEHLDTLRPAELRELDTAIHDLLDHLEATRRPEYADELHDAKGNHYRQEYAKCGKESCKKCSEGKGHGPYWYRYYREGGRLRKQYIGKELHKA